MKNCEFTANTYFTLPIIMKICRLNLYVTYGIDLNMFAYQGFSTFFNIKAIAGQTICNKSKGEVLNFYWKYQWNSKYTLSTLDNYFKLICKYFIPNNQLIL